MINHKQLLTLITVADEGSYSNAAKRLNITQPAVSLQIKAIEQLTGFQIFERFEGEFRLTEQGITIYEHAKIILNQYELMNDFVRQSLDIKNGTLRIATSTIPGEYILPHHIFRFKEHYPNILTEIEISDSSKVIDNVINGEFEIGLVGNLPNHKELNVKKLRHESIKLIKPRAMDFDPISLKQVFEMPHIFREAGSGTREIISSFLNDHKVSVRHVKPTLVLGTTRAVISAVEAGLGLSWVSEYAIKDVCLQEKITIMDSQFDIPRDFYLVTKKKRPLSPLSENFIQYIETISIK